MQRLKRLNIYVGLAFSLIFAILFFFIAVPNLNNRSVELRRMFPVNSQNFSHIFKFSKENNSILKIKYEFKNTDSEIVSLNNRNLELKISEIGKHIRTRYYYIPQKIVKKGDNVLNIKFYPEPPPNVDITIRNFITQIAEGSAILSFRNEAFISKEIPKTFFISLICFFGIFCIWQFFSYLGIYIFRLSLTQSIFSNIISFLPILIIYLLCDLAYIKSSFFLLATPFYLFVLLFLTVAMFNISVNLIYVLLETKKIRGKRNYVALQELSWFPRWIIRFKSRSFSDKCILIFIFLIALCACFVFLGLERIAEKIANIAYILSIIAIIIKFVKFLKKETKR